MIIPRAHPIQALPYLPVYQAFECKHCRIVKVTPTSKTKHISGSHLEVLHRRSASTALAASHWTPVEAQLLTKTKPCTYFAVFGSSNVDPDVQTNSALASFILDQATCSMNIKPNQDPDVAGGLTVQVPRSTDCCHWIRLFGIGEHLAGMRMVDIKGLVTGTFVPVKPDDSWTEVEFEVRVEEIKQITASVITCMKETFVMIQPGGRFPLSDQMVSIMSDYGGSNNGSNRAQDFSRFFWTSQQEDTIQQYVTYFAHLVRWLCFLDCSFIPSSVP